LIANHISVELLSYLNYPPRFDSQLAHRFSLPIPPNERNQPLMRDMILRKVIRPALERAGIIDKVIGWHSFRHSLAKKLRS
jgi:site-specific recombinase XerD